MVAISGQPLLLCSPQCAQLAPPVPGRVDALGWLPDGRVWVMEEKGSLLVLDEDAVNPGPWTAVVSDHAVNWSQSALLKNPWMQHTGGDQRPHPGGKAERSPPPTNPTAAPVPQPSPTERQPKNTPWVLFLGLFAAAVATSLLVQRVRRSPKD